MTKESIVVNGNTQPLGEARTAAEVIRELLGEPAPRGIAVVVNAEVLPRGSWSDRVLTSGDRVEVLYARQGG